jgi:hypothetical protein
MERIRIGREYYNFNRAYSSTAKLVSAYKKANDLAHGGERQVLDTLTQAGLEIGRGSHKKPTFSDSLRLRA